MAAQDRNAADRDPSGSEGPTEHGPVGTVAEATCSGLRRLASPVWGGASAPVNSEHGQNVKPWNPTCSWYQYGTAYGLDGCQHPGMDIGLEIGTTLRAAMGGTVVFAGQNQYYTPFHVKIGTDDDEVPIYGHMSSIDAGVRVDGRVETRQVLGASGTNNGPHLHMERRVKSSRCTSGYCAESPEPIFAEQEPPVAFDVGDRIAVESPPLNFRDAPRLGGQILEKLERDAALCVIGGPQEADGYTWYQVFRVETGDQGWVAGSFCRLDAAQGCQA